MIDQPERSGGGHPRSRERNHLAEEKQAVIARVQSSQHARPRHEPLFNSAVSRAMLQFAVSSGGSADEWGGRMRLLMR